MRVMKTETIQRPFISSVLCNKCGKEMVTRESSEGNGCRVEYLGGYDSEHFGDGTKIYFDICEKCVSELVSTFKIPPEVRNYLDVE